MGTTSGSGVVLAPVSMPDPAKSTFCIGNPDPAKPTLTAQATNRGNVTEDCSRPARSDTEIQTKYQRRLWQKPRGCQFMLVRNSVVSCLFYLYSTWPRPISIGLEVMPQSQAPGRVSIAPPTSAQVFRESIGSSLHHEESHRLCLNTTTL